MTDKTDWWLKEEKPGLYMWIFTKMTLGAAYGALLLAAIIFFILALKALSGLLPEDPYASLDLGRVLIARLV